MNYKHDLTKLVKKLLLVGDIAKHAKSKHKKSNNDISGSKHRQSTVVSNMKAKIFQRITSLGNEQRDVDNTENDDDNDGDSGSESDSDSSTDNENKNESDDEDDDEDEKESSEVNARPANSARSISKSGRKSPTNNRISSSSLFTSQTNEYLDEWQEPSLRNTNQGVSTNCSEAKMC